MLPPRLLFRTPLAPGPVTLAVLGPMLLGVLALAFSGCGALRLGDLPPRAAWAQEGGGPGRTSADAARLDTGLVQAWRFNAEAAFGPGAPLVAGGYVFAATRQGEVQAIRLATGKRAGVLDAGQALEATPALAGDTLVVALAAGRFGVGAYSLRRGAFVWKRGRRAVTAGPLVLGRLAVVADTRGTVTAYALADGTPRWTHALDVPTGTPRRTVLAAPVATSAGIAVADDRGTIRLLDPATGALVRTLDAGGPVLNTPAALGDGLFVPTARGRLVRLALGAAAGWAFTLPDTTVRFSAPSAEGADVVVASTDGSVRLLDAATGALRWTFTTDGALSAAPLLTPTLVFVGTLRRGVVALDRATGRAVWERDVGGRVKSAIAPAAGGIVVLAEPRFVYYFKPRA